jgi:hypothetical protein
MMWGNYWQVEMAPKAPFLLNKRRKLAVFPARRIAYYSSGAEKTASANLC